MRMSSIRSAPLLSGLADIEPHLAKLFEWKTNPWQPTSLRPTILHLGCGEQVIDGFINVDFLPHDDRVLEWDLLDYWPKDIKDSIDAAFSEDVMEHFFLLEQMYIFCSMNCALRRDGVYRVLMPNLDSLVESCQTFSVEKHVFYSEGQGITTGADALNAGLRFSGHRWLHNQESLSRAATICGFAAVPTTCYMSSVDLLKGRNLRAETNSLSFANDLQLRRKITHRTIPPANVVGCDSLGTASDDSHMYRSANCDPRVYYYLPHSIRVENIVLLNIRCSNISQFREHTVAQVYFAPAERHSYYFDETMKSRPCMNLISSDILRMRTREREIHELRFDPTFQKGDQFLLGPLEIFFYD